MSSTPPPFPSLSSSLPSELPIADDLANGYTYHISASGISVTDSAGKKLERRSTKLIADLKLQIERLKTDLAMATARSAAQEALREKLCDELNAERAARVQLTTAVREAMGNLAKSPPPTRRSSGLLAPIAVQRKAWRSLAPKLEKRE